MADYSLTPFYDVIEEPGEALEAAIQGICVVPPEHLGVAIFKLFADVRTFDKLGWTPEEMKVVAAFIERVYAISDNMRGIDRNS
jgi:hypothetical protein